MKFWLLGIASLALIGFGWYRTYQSKKMYLKQETYVKHLDKNLFFSKLGRSLPPWMEEQLQENFQDFAAITKEQVDATFAQIQKVLPTPYIVRYRILDGQLYRYFRSGEPVTLEDNSTERAIKTLMQWVSLPNLDCIISFYDGIRPNHVFFHTTAQAPLLISAKIKSTPYIVLIPDWRSLGEWWASDIKAIKKAWTPWEQKKAFAIWRGTCNREERKTLCRFSLAHPEIVDAKFNLPLNDPALTQEGLMGKMCPGKNCWPANISPT
ncbi:MAG: hypothetical protein KGQ49_05135 [Verrucomicrobia bacterium]|nr:hypothetical protein [Verrucomicrobiota bacterium]